MADRQYSGTSSQPGPGRNVNSHAGAAMTATSSTPTASRALVATTGVAARARPGSRPVIA
jgi:hypothetical protein